MPARQQAARLAGGVQAAAQYLPGQLGGSRLRGQPSRFSATSGSPPTAYTSDSAFVPAIRPNV